MQPNIGGIGDEDIGPQVIVDGIFLDGGTIGLVDGYTPAPVVVDHIPTQNCLIGEPSCTETETGRKCRGPLIHEGVLPNFRVLNDVISAGDKHAVPLVVMNIETAGEVMLASAKGSRTVPVEELYKELKDVELVTQIVVPVVKGQTWGYEKWAMRKRHDYATVAAAVTMTMAGRVCKEVRIALGGVTLPTRRAHRAEEVLNGRSITDKHIDEAAKKAAEDARTGADIHFTAEYKKELVAVMVRRALKQASKKGG